MRNVTSAGIAYLFDGSWLKVVDSFSVLLPPPSSVVYRSVELGKVLAVGNETPNISAAAITMDFWLYLQLTKTNCPTSRRFSRSLSTIPITV